MAAIARDSLTLAQVTEVAYARRYYKLNPSTASAPAAPTTVPPDGASGWGTTEPAYTPASTDSLYTVDVTVLTDGTFDYTPVSKSSSYEAARQAYNKALAAQEVAETGTIVLSRLVIGDATINTATAQAISANVGQFVSLSATQITSGTIAAARIGADTITAEKMLAGTITAASGIIADAAITNAKIANVDAGKITTGFISAAVIAAGSITADKVLIGSGQNAAIDPDFRIANAWSTPTWIQTTGARLGTGPSALIPASATTTSLYAGTQPEYTVAVHEGEAYNLSIYFSSAITVAAANRLSLVVRYRTAAGAWGTATTLAQNPGTVTANTWTRLQGLTVVPAGVTHMAIGFTKASSHNGAVRLSDPTIRTAANGELIVDGAIDGRLITGATIRTSTTVGNGTNGQGIILDTLGLRAHQPNGVQTFGLDSQTGAVRLNGEFLAGNPSWDQVRIGQTRNYSNPPTYEFPPMSGEGGGVIEFIASGSGNTDKGVAAVFQGGFGGIVLQTYIGNITMQALKNTNVNGQQGYFYAGADIGATITGKEYASLYSGSAGVKVLPGYVYLTASPTINDQERYGRKRFNVSQLRWESSASSNTTVWTPDPTLTDSGWKDLVLGANWYNPAPWGPPQYRIQNGMIQMRGRVTGPGGANTPICYLPEEALPGDYGDVLTYIADAGGPVRIGVWGAYNTSASGFRGRLACLTAGTQTNLGLSGISWYVHTAS